VNDRAQRRQHRAGRLPAIGAGDAADRAAVEIGAAVLAQVLDIVEPFLIMPEIEP